MFPVKNLQFYCARWTPSRFPSIWAPTSHTLGEKIFWSRKLAKKAEKLKYGLQYQKIRQFSMGNRNPGSESLYGPYENFENFKTAVNWTPRVELSSCLENINLYYKSLFLRRFLEIRLSVFFGKKRWIFKTLRKNFETILEVWRGRRAGEKERKKKSRWKTVRLG